MKVAVFLFLFFGCGTYTSQTQVERYSYIEIVGDINGEQVIVDDGHPFILGEDTESFTLDGSSVTKIRVEKGKHTLIIKRNGREIIKRVFFVSPGNSFSVNLP